VKHQRNVEGLRQSAQKKRQEALERTENAIKQLIKEGKTITFASVAEAAEVSPAFLYKEDELKARIDYLRSQSTQKKATPQKSKVSDASLIAINQTLKQRIKKLEAEVQGLRRQVEVAYGLAQSDMVSSLESENADLQRQNSHLIKLLTECRAENDLLKPT
jgi:predicted RNase H-like nuclease (RuvC/YqgF family)